MLYYAMDILVVHKLVNQKMDQPFYAICHWGETGLANAGVSLSKMDAPKVGKSAFYSFEVSYQNFRASHSPTVFIRM